MVPKKEGQHTKQKYQALVNMLEK